MELFYENQFIQIFYLPDIHIVKAVWNPISNMMVEADFKTSIQQIWNAVKHYRPVGFLGDTRFFSYVVTIDLQQWYGQNIGDTFGTHTKRIAMLVTSELIAQLSIEQTIEEDHSTVITQYFDNEDRATKWLLS